VAGRPSIPRGYEQLSLSTTVASALTPPQLGASGQPHFALIRTDQDIRWRDDGNDPTASVGVLVKANEVLLYDGKIEDLRLIKVSASATLDVSFYSFGGP